MKTRILSFGCAVALSVMAIAGSGPARAAACPSNYCSEARQSCLAGCSCASFYCNPVTCWSDCVCPIWCPDES
jgi:hypothetical protein